MRMMLLLTICLCLDLAALSEHFLNQFERQFGRGITGLSVSALKQLKGYSWPGNVRELENILERAAAFANDGCIDVIDLG